MDDNAHGTHCAGTIGGVGNNGRGVVGVAHKVSIMACKFLDYEGSGYTSDAISCLDYALNMGATITSNSWGGGGSSPAMSNLIDVAESKGQLFVAAAGNSAGNNDRNPEYPANYPQDIVISVASTTESDRMSSFSCYGRTTVDLGAPGSNIYSTVPGNKYDSFSGTSMATPHVAGALALMYSVNPGLTATDAKRIIMSTGKAISALSGTTVSGKRLDVEAAIAAVGEPTDPPPSTPSPSPSPTPPPSPTPSPSPTPPPSNGQSTEMFEFSSDFDLSNSIVTFTPDGNGGYTTCVKTGVSAYPVNPEPADEIIALPYDDDSYMIKLDFLFPFFGSTYSSAYVGSNGFVTFGNPDYSYSPDADSHFSMPRISALFTDLLADGSSTVSWKKLGDGTAVITYDDMAQTFYDSNRVSMQLSLSPSGAISVMYKGTTTISEASIVVGLSSGAKPNPFQSDDISASPTCATAPTPSPSPSPSPTPSPTTPSPTPSPTTPTPEVCSVICEDDPDYLFKGRRNKGCNWIAKKTRRRCRQGVNVIGCPVTCGACTLVSR